MWSHRSSASSFDDLYDVTDDDSVAEVPIKLSASVKRQARESKERSRFPSLVIPSPSAWPTIQKLQSAGVVGLSPASKIAVTPAALATFNARLLAASPTTSSAPSLDGSLTSEELSLQSCPSTPDPLSPSGSDGEWDQPIQLDPHAFEMLHQLPSDDDKYDAVETVIAVPEEAMREMQEIVKDTPVRHDFALNTVQTLAVENETEEAVSALTIPSPGGFFSSLAPCAAQTWARRTPEPSTGVAEDFYGVPWRAITPPRLIVSEDHSGSPVPSQTETNESTGTQVCHPTEFCERYNEMYEHALKQTGQAHVDRTSSWLDAQVVYQNGDDEESVLDGFEGVPGAVPTSPPQVSSPLDAASPSKKSVRFVDGLDAVLAEAANNKTTKEITTTDDSVFYHAFQDVANRTQTRDAFVHSQARAEAVQVERTNLPIKHSKNLRGDFEISTPVRPNHVRPISSMLPTSSDDDSRKELIASAERERQALDQVKSSVWGLQAERQLCNGNLLNSPAENLIRSLPNAVILDFGGRASGDWGWEVALEYRHATVYTIPMVAEQDMYVKAAKGPSNHRVVTTASPWTLPFPSNMFDVISARSLHALLRSSMPSSSPHTPVHSASAEEDQWELTLAELHRVLKPNGYLEFTVFDAPLLHPGPLGQAASVEFAFNLRTRGYDSCACRTFLPRLRNAGFSSLQRGFLVLPMADVRPRWTDAAKINTQSSSSTAQTNFFHVEKSIGVNGEVEHYSPPVTGSTAAVSAITGLVGARAWEQWMMKLGAEMGRAEAQTVEQVARVLEEGGKSGSGWKCLMGFARK